MIVPKAPRDCDTSFKQEPKLSRLLRTYVVHRLLPFLGGLYSNGLGRAVTWLDWIHIHVVATNCDRHYYGIITVHVKSGNVNVNSVTLCVRWFTDHASQAEWRTAEISRLQGMVHIVSLWAYFLCSIWFRGSNVGSPWMMVPSSLIALMVNDITISGPYASLLV